MREPRAETPGFFLASPACGRGRRPRDAKHRRATGEGSLRRGVPRKAAETAQRSGAAVATISSPSGNFTRFFTALRPCQTGPLHLVSAPSSPLGRRPFQVAPRAARQDAVVAQLVRAPVCGTGGRWFEPTQLYQCADNATFSVFHDLSAVLALSRIQAAPCKGRSEECPRPHHVD